MDSLGHLSCPPTALGRQDDEEATPGKVQGKFRGKKTNSDSRSDKCFLYGMNVRGRSRKVTLLFHFIIPPRPLPPSILDDGDDDFDHGPPQSPTCPL
ncbi:hypothetical protein TNCV_1140971 [Trichonephila clavipes]|nr:hypothetical protein TNCV_1140971 [Trichonephila clavipes]